ncbi:MAG: iron-sulfur cluster carrier protein ApbC [Alphaproteobacteria bacterium]|nr:iron-sulfur cluster carrier protein ApbC [Alphaproteobacteria bacterium]
MSVSKDQILSALRRVKGPDLEGNIVELGLVSEILQKDGRVYFSITVPPSKAEELEPLRQAAEKVVAEIEGVAGATAVLTAEAAPGTARQMPTGANVHEHPRVAEARQRKGGQPGGPPPGGPTLGGPSLGAKGGAKKDSVEGVKHLIAVASGKGGVGKSTTTVNIALGLQALGLKVGILDADIFGPSQPRLLGITGRPNSPDNKIVEPLMGYGLKVMSMGFLVDEGTPIVWRGPMVVQALHQMLFQVNWGELDAILIDMPPGTGDVQLTMAQQVPLSGAVIVSTPQDLALIDARKGLAMFQQVNVPVLGIVENMSTFVCPKCGEESHIFGHGGARIEAQKLSVPFLGGVPLHMHIRETSDTGQPVTATAPDSTHAEIYRDIAAKVWARVKEAEGTAVAPPELSLAEDGATLEVEFADGAKHSLSAEMLRVMSPSAEVQGHSPSERQTVAKKKNVKIKELKPVGNYAVKIEFDDGHGTGLFSWEYLQKLGTEKDALWAKYLGELEAKGLDRG